LWIKIQRHIFTIQALNSPYKIIAADVDTSRSVTAIDLATIQRLILGITTAFPGDQSPWSFVDAAYNFQDPTNPLAEDFPTTITFDDLRNDEMADFIGLKLGDVNNSAQEFRAEEELEVLFKEEVQGEIHIIVVKAPKPQQLAAYQFDINFDPAKMTLLDIEPGTLPGINKANFNLNKLKEGLIPTLWFDPTGNPEGFEIQEGEVLFKLHFSVENEKDRLSNRIWTNANSLPAIAYNPDGEPLKVSNLYQENDRIVGDQIRLEPLRPNPFTEKTEVRFFIPEAAEVSFEIYDALGRPVESIKQDYEAGNHRFEINAQQLNESGWYILKMSSDGYQTNKRFILSN
ncbi:MAG: T9SS type A sorting domain-containing protein, partial [Bacteroidota bacterium]